MCSLLSRQGIQSCIAPPNLYTEDSLLQLLSLLKSMDILNDRIPPKLDSSCTL